MYKIAGIDVHKKMLAVVVADVAVDGEYCFERRKFGTGDSELKALAAWLAGEDVQEVVMESTAQYWRPVWRQLEQQCQLHLAQAQSNRAPRGRKRDFDDAERLVRRLAAGELILSFVPKPEQRLWRTLTHARYQLTRDRVRLHSRLEAHLEDCNLKLSSCVSDLLGVSSRKMLTALADGETCPGQLAALAERELRATPEQLADALAAAACLGTLHREILGLYLEQITLIERQVEAIDSKLATALKPHEEAVVRLAEVPGLGVISAQTIIAEVGPEAATFDTPEQLSSWTGTCPGREESAEVSYSDRCPKGNRMMRRVLDQAANSAIKTKGCVFQSFYRRLMPKVGHQIAVWAVAHKICKVVWKILYQKVHYIEFGKERDAKALKERTRKMIRQLRSMGYQIVAPPEQTKETDALVPVLG